MIKRIALVTLGLLMAVSSVHAQEEQLRERLDASTYAAVTATLDSARRSGLPVEPLVNKALEGASKRAPGARIRSAVSTLAGQLHAARSALGAATSPAELTAGAGALQAGARQADLERLRQIRRDASVLVPLGVLTDLVARGVPPEVAARAVVALAERGANDAEYLALRQNVERDVAAGAPAATSAAVRSQTPAAQPTPGGGLPSTGTVGQGDGVGRGGDGPGRGPPTATPTGKGAEPPGKGPPGKATPPPTKGPPAGPPPGNPAGPPAGNPPGKGPPPVKGPPGKRP